jgi:hypothetical protein
MGKYLDSECDVASHNWRFRCAIFLCSSDPKKLLVEFGVHDRFRVGGSRVARTIKQIIVVNTYENDCGYDRCDLFASILRTVVDHRDGFMILPF